jgi:integrase/recombinase XerD
MLADYFEWLHDTYADTSTMVHYTGLRRFFAFLVDYDEIPSGVNPMKWIKRPVPAIKPVEVLSGEQIRRLLASVEKGKSLSEKRDFAIIRLFLATGMRLSELANLQLEDVHLDEGYAYIRRGKGGNARVAAFGPQVARSIS